MRDAACAPPLGILLPLRGGSPRPTARLPRLRFACGGHDDALRPVFTQAASVGASAVCDGLLSAIERAGTGIEFHRQTSLAKPLARLMLLRAREALREQAFPRPDLVIGVPLHRRRAWHRGFNQSALLAKPLARWLGCRYDDRVLRRIRSTPVQHHLSARLRKKNLRAAFRLELPVRDLHIVIVDDVVTTGSTVGEMAKLLHRHGAATVQVWCLCRTL